MGVIENVKELAATIQKIDNIDLYRKILDLQGEVQNLVQDNRQLRDQVHDLEQRWATHQKLVFRHNVYWLPTEAGGEDGPFCTNCWDNRKTLIRMHQKADVNDTWCPTCKDNINVTGKYEGASGQAPRRF